jgi:YidC/Oxa1 family membrane protein insertase
MSVFFDIVAAVLAYIYALWNNYAWAITGLTLVIMIPMTPLTLKGTRSMMLMQQLQPEMKRIQTRYKDDRQKQNEELLKFYKENNVSPVGGCLPLLVQMPVFIVLYAVLRGLTRRVSMMGFNFGFASGQLAVGSATTKPPVPSLPQNTYFDPSYLRHNTTLYQNLSHTNTMNALGMDLAESASKAVGQGIGHALPYIILIAIVGVTGWIQQRQIQGRTPAAAVSAQQQTIMKMMPFFLPVISIGLPAGLVLYFAVSNLYRVGQQWFIGRSLYSDLDAETAGGKDAAVKHAATGSGGYRPRGSAKGSGDNDSPPTKDAGPTSGPKAPKGGTGAAKKGGFMARLTEASAQARDQKEGGTGATGSSSGRSGAKSGTKSATDGSTSKPPAAKSTSKTEASKTPNSKSAAAKPGSRTKNGSSTKSPVKSSGSSGASSGSANGGSSANGKPAAPVPQPRARRKKG